MPTTTTTTTMGRKADNHIRVADETWSRLNSRKQPGDSFDDVISRLLDKTEESDDEGKTQAREAQETPTAD